MLNYNFEPSSDDETIKNYDGFISPDGKYYPVSIRNKHNPTHQQWAEEFVIAKLDYIKQLAHPSNSFIYTLTRLKDKQDILINFYGYIYYGHDSYSRRPIIIFPNYDINNKEVTESQKELMWNILKQNNELEYFPNNFNEKVNDDKFNKYVDDFIQRRNDMEVKK